jgi:phage protein D
MGLGVAIAVAGVADAELAGARWVEVYERMGQMTTFRIQYPVDVARGDLPMLIDGRIDAGSELAVISPFGGTSTYLVKGPVTNQQVHIEHAGSGSWVEVIGADSTVAMDRETKAAVWPDVTDGDVATTIFARYGFTPDVEATSAGHFEVKHALVQRDTDYRFVRKLAYRNGYCFWVDWDARGLETAHFKRPPIGAAPAAELVIIIKPNNIGSFDVNWDSELPVSLDGAQVNLNDKTTIDGSVAQSPLTPLGSQAVVGRVPRTMHLAAPADDSGDLRARGEAALINAGWFVRARCQTSVNALQAIVRPHTMVSLRGAGTRFSGKYFVSAVRHWIDGSAHRMDIEMLRNAFGS